MIHIPSVVIAVGIIVVCCMGSPALKRALTDEPRVDTSLVINLRSK